MLLCLIMGCLVHYKGLLTAQEKKQTLSTLQNKIYHIHAGHDGNIVGQLDGCILEVEGTQFFRHIFVTSWNVLDAGDGSSPYIGRLIRRGIQWVVEDKTTKGILVLEGLSNLIDVEEGIIVMVGGYVIAPQKIQVVHARVLHE